MVAGETVATASFSLTDGQLGDDTLFDDGISLTKVVRRSCRPEPWRRWRAKSGLLLRISQRGHGAQRPFAARGLLFNGLLVHDDELVVLAPYVACMLELAKAPRNIGAFCTN